MGFMDIHRAIFRLLEIAPVSMGWVWVLYDLLDRLAPEQVATPEKIDHVLTRWATLNDRMSNGEVIEGHHTSLSIKDEFRCLIAALYGRGYANGAFVLHGSPGAKDVAMRCAYYGKGNITAKEMKAAYKRDEKAFAFAVLFNDRIYDSPALRKPLREEYWGGMFERYQRYRTQREKLRQQRREALLGAEQDESDDDDVEAATQQSRAQKPTLKRRSAAIRTTRRPMPISPGSI